MKKRKIKPSLFLITALMFVILFALPLSGCTTDENPFEELEKDGTYTIKSIISTVTVNDDSTVDFVEEITVDFHSPHLGIYRDLPTNSGERYRNIEIIQSEWSHIAHEDYFLRIELGLPDGSNKVKGVQRYKIAYKLILPDRQDNDDVYVNLIGFGFTTNIEYAEVTLYSPEQLSGRKFYTRYGASEESQAVEESSSFEDGKHKYVFKVDGLAAFNGITMKASLPKGTIASYADPFPVAELLVFVVLAAIAVLLVLFSKNGQEVTEITNYYPPFNEKNKRMTPAEAGMYIDGTLSSQDITSMIFYWASKGFLTIDNVDSDDPVLIKQREIGADEAGGPEYLNLFDKIFEDKTRVSVSSLQYNLTAQFQAVTRAARKKTNKIYGKKTGWISKATCALTIIACVATAVIEEYVAIQSTDIFFPLIPWIFLMVIGYVASYRLWKNEYKIKHYKAVRTLTFIATVLPGTFFFMFPWFGYPDVITLAQALLLGTGGSALIFAAGMYNKRTESYRKTLGEVVGFKNFIELAEKEKLEMLLEENPQYYYDVLPYAHVLGVSDKWENKFKDIAVQPPAYQENRGVSMFDMYIYGKLLRRMDTGMRAAMSPNPSSRSKSGFGGGPGGGGFGGGFGGGGFGGGGGGAR